MSLRMPIVNTHVQMRAYVSARNMTQVSGSLDGGVTITHCCIERAEENIRHVRESLQHNVVTFWNRVALLRSFGM